MTTSYLFTYYTLDSQVSLSSSMSIKTGLFSFWLSVVSFTPISGIINYCYVMENWKKKKKSGENKNKLRKMYPNNHKKF